MICRIQLFDSKNTCRTITGVYRNAMEATKDGKRMSMQYHHVIIEEENGGFETYEKGETTEWSYPNGIGQIKMNS